MNDPLNAAELISAVDVAVTRVRTRSLDVSFNELFDMYQSDELVIYPDYQRLFRWSVTKQSQFIESMILELPIPPIYVIEVQDGVYELIDGLQRISSYFHFRGIHPNAEKGAERFLELKGCDVLPELDGATYKLLPQALRIKLKRHFIRMEVLRKETDPQLRYHMFKRLNTGGEVLSPQEIRNCTIRLLDNAFNDFLKEVIANSDFAKCTSQITDEKRDQMYLEEFALRFFAFKNNRDGYVKDVGDFLTAYMESVSDAARETTFDYDKERLIFARTFKCLNRALGVGAFSGFNEQGNPMGYFSALHFEAFTLGVQSYLESVVDRDEEAETRFAEALKAIKMDGEFKKLTTGGGKNYAAALRRRIEFVKLKVDECLR